MRSLIATVLCVCFVAPGCAARSSSRHPSALAGTVQPQAGEIPRAYAAQLPAGHQVEVRLKSGEHFKGTFMGVEGDAIRVQPSTRIPVPTRVVPLGDLLQLRLAPGNGVAAAKAVVIGAAAGAAVFFGLLLMAIGVSSS